MQPSEDTQQRMARAEEARTKGLVREFDRRLREGEDQHAIYKDLQDRGVQSEVVGWALALAVMDNGGKVPKPPLLEVA